MKEALKPVSQKAVQLYIETEDKILFLLNQKLETSARLGHNSLSVETRLFIQGISALFCKTVAGLYEFSLYEHLKKEYTWFLSVLLNRNMSQKCFEHLLKEWDMGVHTFIRTEEANELVAPFMILQKCFSGLEKNKNVKSIELSDDYRPFFNCVIEKDREKAINEVFSLSKKGVSLETILTEMFPAVLEKIGELWQKNKISVVGQHVATDICNHVLMKIAEKSHKPSALPGKVITACVPGETHEMSCEILETFLETKGWCVQSMGHVAPHNDMLQSILEIKPDIIFFSVSMIARLSAARLILKDIRKLLPQAKIILGGNAAIAAQKELLLFSDAVVNNFAEGHQKALELIKNA